MLFYLKIALPLTVEFSISQHQVFERGHICFVWLQETEFVGQEHATINQAVWLRSGKFQKLFPTPTPTRFHKILLSPKLFFQMFLTAHLIMQNISNKALFSFETIPHSAGHFILDIS